MSHRVYCPNCRKRLKVPGERIGTTAQCPGCSHTFTLSSESLVPAESLRYWVRQDGESHGPFSQEELCNGLACGRLARNTLVEIDGVAGCHTLQKLFGLPPAETTRQPIELPAGCRRAFAVLAVLCLSRFLQWLLELAKG